MLKAVIFDLDGVLIDSEPLMRFAFDAVYQKNIGEGITPIEQYLEHMGESFPRIMDALGLPRTLWEPYRKLCQENLHRIAFYPEARSLLQVLTDCGIKLALLTGKDYARTSQILDHFDVRRFFNEVITSDQLRNAKPHPEGVIRALKLLDCTASETAMIGDAVNDIVCAQQAGVTAIAVTWGIKPERLESLCRPDHVVHNWQMLQQLLLSRVELEGSAVAPSLAPEHSLKNSEPLLLGLEIGGTHVRAAIAHGTEILDARVTTWPGDLSPAEEVDYVADFALELAGQAGGGRSLSSTGVSAAALVDETGAVVSWPNRPAWRGLQLHYLLQRRLGLRVTIEDDANTAALAEWKLGAARGYQNAIVITVGTGIGAGLIFNNKPYRGTRGWAGELGHITVAPEGSVCACGKRGCLQLIASGRALDRAAAERGLADAASVAAAAGRDEAWAIEAMQSCAGWLGVAIANVVNLLDLDAVIIGGGLAELGPPWWTTLEQTWREFLLNGSNREVALKRAALGEMAGLQGAIILADQVASKGGARTRGMHG